MSRIPAALARLNRAICPVCLNDVALTPSGKLWRHGPQDADQVRERRYASGRACPGGGKPPENLLTEPYTDTYVAEP